MRPRLLYRDLKCLHTNYPCIKACRKGAIQINDQGSLPILIIDRSQCDRCTSLECTFACANGALQVAGRYYEVDELMEILKRDQDFWGSQGGVTFTGGEPLMQGEFLLEVLRQCSSSYMHTAIETSAQVNIDLLLEAIQWIDWMFIDIKHMYPKKHREKTGADNGLILKNIETIAASGWDGRCIIRLTIIPEYNDTEENLNDTAEFMKHVGLEEINLLPFHRLGNTKYKQLGQVYEYSQVESPTRECMLAHQSTFEKAGLRCYVDFETPF